MILFVDPGGRMYTVAGSSIVNILAHWTSCNNTAGFTVLSGGGRITGTCLRCTALSIVLSKDIPASPTVGVAMAFKTAGYGSTSPGFNFVAFGDVSSSQVELRLNSNGTISITRNGTVLGTTTAIISLNTWTHIEWKNTIHSSTGASQLWFNEVSVLNLTGINTQNSANAYAVNFQIGNQTFAGMNPDIHNLDYDDIIVYNNTATDALGNTAAVGPIGNFRVYNIQPTGAGNSTQFTPDSGSNYARINETTPDGDTSYVESSTIGNKDTYAMGDLPSNVKSVIGISSYHYSKKTDVGARTMTPVLRIGSTDYDHPTAISLGDSYAYNSRQLECSPATNAAFTLLEINALEAGQKVSS